ncbi:hypothetical protein pb186bvf_008236 [Paramecium bursaria]
MNQEPKYCCLPIQRALVLIIYFDMTRVVWGLLICAFLFQSNSPLALIITIVDIILIVLQSCMALYVNMRAIPQQNIQPVSYYRKAKIVFIMFNIMDRLIVPIINCTLIYRDSQDLQKQYCETSYFATLIVTAIIWNFIEYIIYGGVKAFCLNFRRNDYRPINLRTQQKQKRSGPIIYEVKGLRPPQRRGQIQYNQDSLVVGQGTQFSYVKWFEQNKLKPIQNFQITGKIHEIDQVNLTL